MVNKQGIEVGRLEAQKTPEQLAEDERKRLDAERSASRDKNLLNTYVSVQEIERLRDQRLTLLSDQIKVTGQFLEILDGKLKKLRAASMHFKPYSADPNAPPMSDQIAEDLVRVEQRHPYAGGESPAEAHRGRNHARAIRQRYRALQRAQGHPLRPKTRILLGVTGGIAAYKSPDLVRRLIERGAEVQVVMTASARKFITPDELAGGFRPPGPKRPVGQRRRGRHGSHRTRPLGRARADRPGERGFHRTPGGRPRG